MTQQLTQEPLVVGSHSFLTLHYRLSRPDGMVLIDTFSDKPATISLGTGELTPGLEQYLLGLQEGEVSRFEVPGHAAFGEHDPSLMRWVSRAALKAWVGDAETYTVGEVFSFPTPDGQSTYAGVVVEVADDAVLFDLNHPLAGQPLHFEVKILGILG